MVRQVAGGWLVAVVAYRRAGVWTRQKAILEFEQRAKAQRIAPRGIPKVPRPLLLLLLFVTGKKVSFQKENLRLKREGEEEKRGNDSGWPWQIF